MKKRQWKRVLKENRFTLSQAVGEPLTFIVRWRKCANPERYGQRIFQSPTVQMAVKMAPVIAGFEAVTGSKKIFSLFDAFLECLNKSKRDERSRRDWNNHVRLFAKYLSEHHPLVGNWNQLSRAIIRGYDETLTGKSPNRRRLLFQPITQTDLYMHREYGFDRVADGLRMSGANVRKTCHLYMIDVVDFLNWLKGQRSPLEAPIALQALAGMRLEEVYRLSWDRIDLVRGLIEISGRVKTDWSERIIPICNRALSALKRAQQERSKILNIGADMLVTNYGTSETYAQAVTKAIKKWNPNIRWRPGDLRNLLPTWATTNSCNDDLWEQYIGHAPTSITARHYVPRLVASSAGEHEEIMKAMEVLKFAVTKRLDEAVAEAEKKITVDYNKERERAENEL